jgi:hypothetical protein
MSRNDVGDWWEKEKSIGGNFEAVLNKIKRMDCIVCNDPAITGLPMNELVGKCRNGRGLTKRPKKTGVIQRRRRKQPSSS